MVVAEKTKRVNVGRNPRSGPLCGKTGQVLAMPQGRLPARMLKGWEPLLIT